MCFCESVGEAAVYKLRIRRRCLVQEAELLCFMGKLVAKSGWAMLIRRCARVGYSPAQIHYTVFGRNKNARRCVSWLWRCRCQGGHLIFETGPFLVCATLVTAIKPRPPFEFFTPRTKSNCPPLASTGVRRAFSAHLPGKVRCLRRCSRNQVVVLRR